MKKHIISILIGVLTGTAFAWAQGDLSFNPALNFKPNVSTATGTLSPANGGTGVANNAAATLTRSGSHALTLTTSGTTSVTLPTSGTVLSDAAVITPAQGGTGVANNNAATITRSGNHAVTITTTGTTGVTLPTSGTLLGTAAAVTTTQGGTGQNWGASSGVPLLTTGTGSLLDYVPWTTPAFSAGNFTASGSMTWTVGAGDVTTYEYTIIGKTMTVNVVLSTTTVGGTPATALFIAIPAGKTAAKTAYAPAYIADNGTESIGYCRPAAAGTTIAVGKVPSSNWTASTDATLVTCSITFEIQ